MDSSTTPEPVYKTRLQRILSEEGRRQTWLATRVGIHSSRLNLFVNGLAIDDDDLREKIAEALRRTTADVFDTPIDAPLELRPEGLAA